MLNNGQNGPCIRVFVTFARYYGHGMNFLFADLSTESVHRLFILFNHQ
jgi:hypothetical protein